MLHSRRAGGDVGRRPQLSNKTCHLGIQQLLFATDPVALDPSAGNSSTRSVAEGWPVVAAMGLDASTGVGKIDGSPIRNSFISGSLSIPLAETLGLSVCSQQDRAPEVEAAV